VGEPALCRALGLREGAPRGAVVAELRALAASPALVRERLGDWAEWLTVGLVNVVNMLGPELVVLGDLFTVLPASLIADVADKVRQRSLVSRAVGGIRLEVSTLGADSTLLGAAELAFEPVLDAV
jgi:predicted NBD/HSP70 family sugar kinase